MISPPAVDVHAHVLPPSYGAALKRAEIDPPPLIHAAAEALPETELLDDNQKRGMFTDNAQPLIARLAELPA